MNLPTSFKEKIMNCFGSQGEVWLSSLEDNVKTAAKDWGLHVGSPVTNLSYNYVLNVTDQNNHPYILKMGLPGYDFENEIRTLQLYSGQGCARLIKEDAERGAMLIEKLHPGTMLSNEADETVVIQQFCHVWKQIRRPMPNDGEFPNVLDWSSAFTRYQNEYVANDGPIPINWVKRAEVYLHEIQQSTESELLHGDLHHENILFSKERGWLAIDPKGVVGSNYFDIVSYMNNHLFTKPDPEALLKLRVDLLSESLQLDRERLLKAAIAMSILYACWSVEDKDPEWNQTFQCAKWFKSQLEQNK